MYVDSSTFWIIAIALGAAIGIVYYLLDKKIDDTKKEILGITKDILIETVNSIGEEMQIMEAKHQKDIEGAYARTFAPADIERIAEKAIEKRTSNKNQRAS